MALSEEASITNMFNLFTPITTSEDVYYNLFPKVFIVFTFEFHGTGHLTQFVSSRDNLRCAGLIILLLQL